MKTLFIHTYVSVDCVVFGFDSESLNVLLIRRNTEKEEGQDLKLPGSLIYQDEDADIAAHRVLKELTGINKMALKQFKSFTSPQRTSNPDDVNWLEYEAVYRKKYDIRNFHKKIIGMEYIVPTGEWQSGVAHRAARFYKFDKVLYKKRMTTIE